MTKYLGFLNDFSHTALFSEAEKTAQTVQDNTSATKRTSTPDEARMLTNIMFGALVTLQDGCNVNVTNPSFTNGVLTTAERIGYNLMPNINCWESIYKPILKIVEDLDLVSSRARSIESDYYFNGYNIDHTSDGNLRISHNYRTVAYEDGPFEKLKTGLVGNLANQYISGDDIRREDAEKAENEPILDFFSDSRK